MIKYIATLFSFVLIAHASWVQEYKQGDYLKQPSKLYAMAQSDMTDKRYKTIAFNEAIADVSSQLFSQVSSRQFLKSSSSQDHFSSSFQQKIHVVSNLPIHGVSKERETTIDGKYFLLLSFDKESAAHIYKEKANSLAKELDAILEDYKKQKSIASREVILNTLSRKLESYEKYLLVARLLNQKNMLQPKIKPYFIEKQLRELHNTTSKNIEELSSILASAITKSKIDGSIKVMPFSYEDRGIYSSFSSELRDYLEKALSEHVNITSKHNSPYKLSGNYFLQGSSLVAKAVLYDSFGDIVAVSMAKMKIDKRERSHYIPKKNEYANLNEPTLSSNLTIQARMNKMSRDLLFKEGDSVNLEIKVSKESYVYIIGNMRTEDGKQIQYLMPLNDRHGKAKYQMHIPYQNANLWVSVGEFTVYPPFGVEVLQIFATNIDIIKELPHTKTTLIDGQEYDVIVDKNKSAMPATQSIQNFRGLKLSKRNKELEKAETIVKFSTVSMK